MSTGTSSAGPLNIRGVGLFFVANIAIYLENGTILLQNTNRKSMIADRSVSVAVTFSDLEGLDAKGQAFPDDLRNYALTV